MELKSGALIETQYGPIQIIKKVGSGGMGSVYRAKDLNTDRQIAFKTTDSATNLSDQDIMRFEAEARTMQKIEHQNIVPFYNYGNFQDRLFISMKFIEGKALEEVIQEHTQLGLQETLYFTRQIAKGLQYLHQQDIVHRDLKPSNVMLSKEGRVFLSDFGISQMSNSIRLTHTGMTMGTPEYMSPEQCQGLEITSQSDMYSLGIIIYEMLTGKPPLSGDKPLAIAWKQVHEEVALDPLLKAGIPEALVKLIGKLLSKDLIDRLTRFEDIFSVLDSLSEVQNPVIKPIKIKSSNSLPIPSLNHLTKFAKNLSFSSLVISIFALTLTFWSLQKKSNTAAYEFQDKTQNSIPDLELSSKPFIQSLKNGQDNFPIVVDFQSEVLLLGIRYSKGDENHPSPAKVETISDSGSKRKNALSSDLKQYLHFSKPLVGKSFEFNFLLPQGSRSFSVDRISPVYLNLND